jgi:hypothetical protein
MVNKNPTIMTTQVTSKPSLTLGILRDSLNNLGKDVRTIGKSLSNL